MARPAKPAKPARSPKPTPVDDEVIAEAPDYAASDDPAHDAPAMTADESAKNRAIESAAVASAKAGRNNVGFGDDIPLAALNAATRKVAAEQRAMMDEAQRAAHVAIAGAFRAPAKQVAPQVSPYAANAIAQAAMAAKDSAKS